MISFDSAAFSATLQKVFSENGLSKLLNYERVGAFEKLTRHMLEENEKYNLTAIVEPEKIILLHYADCVCAAKYLPKGARVADIGCGAGFPTLPLAIVRPDLHILAMDSTEKRVRYVAGAAELLGLTNVQTKAMRAEDGAHLAELRESFDVVVSRAVAQMRVLTELCLAYVRVGGEMLAMKGKNAAYELADAKKALAVLGGRALPIEQIPLRSAGTEDQNHALIRVTKEKKTPEAYPRPYAQISKKPL